MSNSDTLIAAMNSLTKALDNFKGNINKDSTTLLTENTAVIKEQTEVINDLTLSIRERNNADQENQKTKEESDEKAAKQTEKAFKQTEKLISVQEELNKVWPTLGPKIATLKNSFTGILETLKSSLKSLPKKLKDIFDKTKIGKKLKPETSLLGDNFKSFGKGIGKFTKGISIIGKGLLGGAKSLMMNPVILGAKAVISGLITVFTTAIKFGAKFAKIMVGLPLQIVGSAAKIGHSLRRDVVEVIGGAVEKVKEFVDVNDGLGKSIKDMSTSSAMSLDKFSDPTSDLVKMFGDGPSGLARAIQESSQAFESMGILADIAGGSIARNITHYTKATRSLGMSAEDVSYITAEAVKNGESIYTTLDRVVVASSTTADQFGIDRKKLSKNFFTLRKDITNFGHLSDRQLMQTSARLTQMGVSMKEASAVFSKIDSFESAAQTSAMLSQTFGMNLDALKLLKAEKPEEIIEQFRDAMLSTGRSFDDLNRHEKSLMASHTGLSAEALKMTMNYRTLGMSYTDIQKKMKEDDPTHQQIKNLKLMSGSLTEIKKTLGGDNIFKNFANGLAVTIKNASGLTPVLLRVSKRFEDFFIAGLKVSKGTKSALVKAFSPFKTVLEEMVGDGKNNKGLLNAGSFKGTFENFAIDMGGYFERIFSGKENLAKIQKDFSESVNDVFSFASFNKGNNFVGTLMKSGGKIVGQLLKAFTAIGPGLIDVFATTLEDLVNWLDSDITSGDNSLAKTFSKLFNINKTDADAMVTGLTKIFDTIVEKILPSLFKLSKPIFKFVYDAVTTIVGIAWNAVTKKLENSPLGSFMGFFDRQDDEAKDTYTTAKTLGLDLKDVNKDLINELKNANDYGQVRGIATLEAIIDKQANKTSTSENEKNTLKILSKSLGGLYSSYKFDSMSAYHERLDNVLEGLKKYSATKNITLDISQANDAVSDARKSSLLGSGGMALVRNSSSGLDVTQYAAGDQVVAGKEGGPIVNAIAYAGNAINWLLEKEKSMLSALSGTSTPSAGMGSSSEIKIYLQVDGNTLSEVVLDNDLIRKATVKKNGRYTLSDGSVIDAAGSSVQSSSV